MNLSLKNKKFIIFGIIVIILIGIISLFFISVKKSSLRQVSATFDDFPIWLLRDGKVAVYRELDFCKDSIEKQIVVINVGKENQKDLKIYDSVSKLIAQSASELEFNIKPEIIEDDPFFAWTITTNQAGERILLTVGKKVNLSKVSDACQNEQVVSEMITLNLKPESFNDCMKYWRNKEEEAQRKVEEDLKEQSEKETIKKTEIIEVIEPGTDEYKKIQTEAKKALPKKIVSSSQLQQPSFPSSVTPKKPGWMVYFSNDMFPSELLGLSQARVHEKETAETCYDSIPPTKFLGAIYQNGNQIISVAATQYSTAEIAKTVPKICSDYTEAKMTKPQFGGLISLEKKEDVLGYPFWIAITSYQGSPFIVNSFSVIEDTVIAVMMPGKLSSVEGGTETEHRNAMTILLTYIKQKVGCGGDSDCASYLCYNCVFGQRKCVKGNCVECVYDGHCKDGFKCENNYCVEKETSTLKNESIEIECRSIDLSAGDALYNYTKANAPCDQYQNSLNDQNLIKLRCENSSAEWRNYWVKKINVAGNEKIKIKADLGLQDHSRFFSECDYNGGVKYDNYASLIVLKENPMPTLDAECYKKASVEEWSKCSVPKSGSSVLGICGVPKCSTSIKCDFEADVSGLNFAYLVFSISDAWSADIEGTLANLKICPIK